MLKMLQGVHDKARPAKIDRAQVRTMHPRPRDQLGRPSGSGERLLVSSKQRPQLSVPFVCGVAAKTARPWANCSAARHHPWTRTSCGSERRRLCHESCPPNSQEILLLVLLRTSKNAQIYSSRRKKCFGARPEVHHDIPGGTDSVIRCLAIDTLLMQDVVLAMPRVDGHLCSRSGSVQPD